ncbi:MAG: diguanylate cyclase [Proteobacteria bacterium]|nr:diguanylate cyclase [Pseudomonadota bacterium]
MKNYKNMTKKQLVGELERIRQRIEELGSLEIQHKVAEESLLRKTGDLGKRVKELNCLYSISRLVEKGELLEDILQGIVDLIPPAMQYPDISCARVIIDDKELRTGNFKETKWKLSRDIIAGFKRIGVLEVCCLEEMSEMEEGLFLNEEKNLVYAVSERLGRIIERKRSEDALRESEEKYSTVIEKVRDGIVIIQDYVYRFANRAMTEISGYSREEIVGMPFLEIFAPEYRDLINERYELRMSGEEIPPVYETKIQCKDRTIKDVEMSFGIIPYDRRPADMGCIRDITERRKAEEKIRRLAFHDDLTGLPNRVLFNEQFTLARAHAQRYKQRLVVMLLDLDRFKDINDTLGHKMGDKVLQMVARRLRALVREEDIVARMGGDEFILYLQDILRLEDIDNIAQKIVETFQRPFVFEGHELMTTTSIGVALYPDDGEDIDTLLKNADIAMYRAKEQGRNKYRFYARPVHPEASK